MKERKELRIKKSRTISTGANNPGRESRVRSTMGEHDKERRFWAFCETRGEKDPRTPAKRPAVSTEEEEDQMRPLRRKKCGKKRGCAKKRRRS